MVSGPDPHLRIEDPRSRGPGIGTGCWLLAIWFLVPGTKFQVRSS